MMKILLAIDDSKFSEAALEMVMKQNRPEDTEVRVLHIAEPFTTLFPAVNAGAGYYPPEWDRFQKELSEHARELVERAADKLRKASFQADTLFREGAARPEIVDAAKEWRADLIVLGAHGRSGLERLLLGSVSDFVARHAKCSVEIVRLPSA
jgi:nucleotide-binding universal stress UspA family protein